MKVQFLVAAEDKTLKIPWQQDLPKEFTLLKEFNLSEPIGTANVFQKNNTLLASADVPNKLLDWYPSLGMKNVIRDKECVITSFDIAAVSLCSSPNVDPAIKSIREQIKNKKL